MNKRILLWVSMISITLSFTNCTETSGATEEPETVENDIPNESVLRTFENMYGDAQSVKWSIQGDDYYIADFVLDSWPATAWFSKQGEWALGKVSTSLNEIESLVLKAFSQTDYSVWNIDDAHVLERKGLSKVYLLGVANNNEKSKLYFTKYGDFVKAIDDSTDHVDMPVDIPSQLLQTVNQLFSEPEIVDITENDEWMTEINVGILENTAYKVAALDSSYEWLSTFWNLTESTVPSAVWQGFAASEYAEAEYKLIGIKAMQDSDSISYIFYVEDKENKDYVLSFDANGVLHSIIS